EEIANKFVLPTLLLGTLAYLLTRQPNRFTSTLIIDYHTGIHLSAPLCVMSHIAEAAKQGILIKCGSKLEVLKKVDTIILDKTGTLTLGHPKIMDLIGFSIHEEEVLRFGASLEQKITHPVARALVKLAEERNVDLLPRENSKYHIGLGIEGDLDGEHFILGSTMFMLKKKIKIPPEVRDLVEKLHSEAKSVLYLVRGRQIVGLITFADPPRDEAYEVIRELKKRGKQIILCTGDNEGVAKHISKKLGIDRYFARAFPEEKVKIVNKLKEEGRIVAFVGDGVNDSPALTSAHVGISLRGGTEIALELADIVIGENLKHLVEVIDLAERAFNKLEKIYQTNILVNTIGLIGSAIGIFNPALSTIINNGSTIILGLYAIKK
ncbi:MAG: HAD-IC family P-type ATPase, partial [Caldimicrobium sp.]